MSHEWLGRLADRLAGEERFEITRSWEQTPYLTRWTLLGRRFAGSRGAVFLHHFQRSDADEMHDHPFGFTSLILAGGYWEVTPGAGWAGGVGPTRCRWHPPGLVLRRPARWIHRIEIPPGADAWTLVFRGPKERSWGFWCPHVGWVPWRQHLANARATGAGCPEG